MIKHFFVLCLCLFLTGCGYKKESGEVIQFSTWGSASEMAILKPVISDFEAQNPDIKIELLHIPQDYFQKLHLLFASNLAPDVIFINNLNLPVYSGRLENLNKILDKSDYYPQSIKALSVNGNLYAIPRDVSNLVIYYNKTLFRKYNVKYPDKNWSLDDLVETSRLLTRKGVFGISYEPLVYYAMPYMYYYGGGILSDDLKYIAESESSKSGLRLYKDLAYKYHYAPLPSQTGSKTLAQMFLDGQIAMHLSGRWLVPKYRECANFDWDVVNFPRGKVPCDASGWAISKSSQHKDSALKFVLFLSNKTNIEKMTSCGLIVPARIDVSESKIFLSGKPEHSELFLYTAGNSKAATVSRNYNNLIDKINDSVFVSD